MEGRRPGCTGESGSVCEPAGELDLGGRGAATARNDRHLVACACAVTSAGGRAAAERRRRGGRVRFAIAAAVVALMLLPALAHADALDDGVRRVALQLQCPVCEGETVADYPSGLARDMRGVIRTRLTAGDGD